MMYTKITSELQAMSRIKNLGSSRTQSSTRNKVQGTQENRKTSQEEGARRTSAADEVTITSSGAQLANIEKALDAVPVVNAARVGEIKTAVDGGSYDVDSGKVADKLIESERERARMSGESELE